jgi:chemotaxis protein histidine kinase CheA
MEPERAQQLHAWEAGVRDNAECGCDIEAHDVRLLFDFLDKARARISNLENAIGETAKEWAIARSRIIDMEETTQRALSRARVAEQAEDDTQEVNTRLAKLLTESVNLIRGVPIDSTLYSWHDLPDRIRSLKRKVSW